MKLYHPVVEFVLEHKWKTIAAAIIAMALTVPVFFKLGNVNLLIFFVGIVALNVVTLSLAASAGHIDVIGDISIARERAHHELGRVRAERNDVDLLAAQLVHELHRRHRLKRVAVEVVAQVRVERLAADCLFDQAEKEFREAVRLEPTAQNHYSLAACLMAIGHNDEALAELENASRLDPAQNLYRARKEELLKMMAQPSHQ